MLTAGVGWGSKFFQLNIEQILNNYPKENELSTSHRTSWVFPPPHTTCLVDFDRCQVISDNCK